MACVWTLLPTKSRGPILFHHLGNAVNKYTQNYYRSVIIGDFNVEDSEPCLSEFLHDYNAEKIVKRKKHVSRA